MKSVSSVLKKNWGPSPALPKGRERLARWERCVQMTSDMGVQVSVVSGHRVAMIRSIKVCRMENPLHPSHPLFNKSMWSGGYCTQFFLHVEPQRIWSIASSMRRGRAWVNGGPTA